MGISDDQALSTVSVHQPVPQWAAPKWARSEVVFAM